MQWLHYNNYYGLLISQIVITLYVRFITFRLIAVDIGIRHIIIIIVLRMIKILFGIICGKQTDD